MYKKYNFVPMANRIKKTKEPKQINPERLIEEKEEQVAWQSITKDERTHKIIGVIFLLIGLFLFIAFTSYLFTWSVDQDQVMANGFRYLIAEDVKATNLLGRLGALTAHVFIYKFFGVAAYLCCTFFFIVGINLIFAKKYFSVIKNIKYVIIGLVVFSVLFAFIFSKSNFSWGGAFGQFISGWMSRFAGQLGTGILLFAAALSYVIWRFNPVFKLPQKNVLAGNGKPIEVENSLDYESQNFQEQDDNSHQAAVNKEFANKGNVLKTNKGVVVISPNQETGSFNNDLQLIEREGVAEEELPIVVNEDTETKPILPIEEKKDTSDAAIDFTIPVAPKKEKFKPNGDDLALEINEVPLAVEKPVEEKLTERKTVDQPYEPTLDLSDYKYPSIDMLENHGSERIVQDPTELETNKNQIITTLRNYDIEIQKIMATVGPTVTLYEIVPAPGVRISRIKNLEDDIALSLAALGIRIIAPIPGKGTIGIEVPNLKKTIVSMKTLLASEKFQNNSFSLPIALGKKIDNENFIVDLATMPHLLMAGATGQGKSVGLNAVLVSLLYKKHPSQLKLILVDPKKVELSLYRHIEKHFLAKLPGEEESIITDTKKVVHTLNALCIEMDNRYDLLKEAGCRNIKEYNEKFIQRKLNPEKGHQYLPFIVLVIDEFADLIMTAGKEVEMPIARLAQLARAIGIHLIIATQRPSVNIITGTIKANFPARIAFKVSSKIDSRTILDAGGAEQLIGKGDMLVSYNGELTRLQCAFVDTPEVDKVVEYISGQRGYPQAFLLPEYMDENDSSGKEFSMDERDNLFDDAARLIVMSQSGSTSLIQRKMKLGYNRAGRVMDQLEAAGIVGPAQGSKPRDVYIKTEADLEQHLGNLG
jgi:DNA segregation ATPase FtsK/SpoIIIE, S-DNA-T family